MQYSQEHLKTMVYAKFGGQTECIMGNSKIENKTSQGKIRRALSDELWGRSHHVLLYDCTTILDPGKGLRLPPFRSTRACEQALLFGRARAPRSFAPRSRVLARLTLLAQVGELARRLEYPEKPHPDSGNNNLVI